MEIILVDDFDVEIDRQEVLRLLGSRRDTRMRSNERLERVLKESLAGAETLIEPKGVYTVTAGNDLPGSRTFEDLDRVAFCICTIGRSLEARVSELSRGGDLLRSVVLDAIGSVAAEAVAGHIDGMIRDEASRDGFQTSCRASPGYGDWDIREQACIFRLLPGERIGVTLSRGFMMMPRKSISFAIHIAEHPKRLRSENSCRNCDVSDCPYRILE